MKQDVLHQILQDIEHKIDSIDMNPEIENVGEVLYLGDGVAKVSGLTGVRYNEVVEFDS